MFRNFSRLCWWCIELTLETQTCVSIFFLTIANSKLWRRFQTTFSYLFRKFIRFLVNGFGIFVLLVYGIIVYFLYKFYKYIRWNIWIRNWTINNYSYIFNHWKYILYMGTRWSINKLLIDIDTSSFCSYDLISFYI